MLTNKAIFYLLCLLAYSSQAFSNTTLASEQKILICGVCKNVEGAVANTISNIESLGSRFADYTVIIYENNSEDKTASLLTTWANENPHVILMSQNLPAHSLSSSRVENIARARNIVLSVAKWPDFSDHKFLVMADLDFGTPWPIDEIVRSVELPIEWDCISANGILNEESNTYYDRYAFRNETFPLGDELLGNTWWEMLRETPITFSDKTDLVPVFSSFGGLAIYKTEVITKYRYSGTVTNALTAYYTKIIGKTPSTNAHLVQYLKSIKKSKSKLPNIPITYCHGACCEHVTLHAAMAQDGHDKFFVNPNMIMDYNFQSKKLW